MTQQNISLTGKEILAQQWYLTRLCFGRAPGYMALHLFESVKLQISIFFEFTWCINFVLEAAENHAPWRDILLCMGILLAAIAVSTASFAFYMQKALPKFKPMLYHAFRMEIYTRTKDLDLSCYDDTDFYQKFILSTQEADACIDRYLDALNLYSGQGVRFVLLLIYCLTINPAALLIPLFLFPLDYMLVKKGNALSVKARMERVSHEQKREYQNRLFYLSDYAKDLRLYPSMQQKCRQDFGGSNQEIRRINRAYGKPLALCYFAHDALLGRLLREAVTWSLLLYQVLVLHSLSYAHMITISNSIGSLTNQGMEMMLCWKNVMENSAYVAQIRRLLSVEPAIVSHNGLPVPGAPACLETERLNFSYQPGHPVLSDINLKIQPAQKIALVGYNGSGKTTLVKLLMRLYDPTSGKVCLNGTDIREFDVRQYRFSIGSVFQDFKIYAATLKENVRMDICHDTPEETYEIESALYNAHFSLQDHRLIYQIETPMTTEFEKDGVNLSGGEAQKVAIARTLYRKQNMIIMDEPSSALDPLSEYLLNQELNEIARDKTVIFISHRLSTTRDADCIYMMEQGRIIESGTHEELLKLDGKYASMWNVQASLYRE